MFNIRRVQSVRSHKLCSRQGCHFFFFFFLHNLNLSRMSLLGGKKKYCYNWMYIRRVDSAYVWLYRLCFTFKILSFRFLPFKYLPAQDCRLQESLQAVFICLCWFRDGTSKGWGNMSAYQTFLSLCTGIRFPALEKYLTTILSFPSPNSNVDLRQHKRQ